MRGGARPRRPASALFPTGRRSPAATVAPGSAPKLTPARRGGAAAPRPPPTPGRGRRGSRRGTARLLLPAGGCAAPGSRRAAPGPGRAGGAASTAGAAGVSAPGARDSAGVGWGLCGTRSVYVRGGHLLPRRQQGSAGGKRLGKVRLRHWSLPESDPRVPPSLLPQTDGPTDNPLLANLASLLKVSFVFSVFFFLLFLVGPGS